MRERDVWGILIIPTVLILVYLSFRNPLPPVGFDQNREPLYLGYRSNTIRIEALNLTELSQLAHESGYNVTTGERTMDAEWVEGYSFPTPGSNFQLYYSARSNYTYFSLSYPENSSAMVWLWDTLRDSLNLTTSEFLNVQESAISQYWVDVGGAHLGTYIQGARPNWSIMAKHLGVETGRDIGQVGVVKIAFDSGATMTLFSDPLLITGKVEGKEVVCVVNVDGDSDVCLFVDSSVKLDDPIKLFTPMFDALGIPNSELAKLSLEESWAYPV